MQETNLVPHMLLLSMLLNKESTTTKIPTQQIVKNPKPLKPLKLMNRRNWVDNLDGRKHGWNLHYISNEGLFCSHDVRILYMLPWQCFCHLQNDHQIL